MGEVQEEQEDVRTPLLHSDVASSPGEPVQPLFRRTGNLRTAVAHIITGVIGSGVLSLAWSMAQLGWIAGPLVMVVCASVTLFSSFLLCNCYRYPHPEHGPARNSSYLEAVRVNLGASRSWVCVFVIQISLFGTGIAYVITSATSMRAIEKSNCYHKYGHEADCEFGYTHYMLIFGVVQIVVSQIPNFHNMEWLSVVAAVMSFTYSFIALGLGLAKVLGDGVIKGSIAGISTSTAAQKVWLVCQALGDILFAYPYNIILIEIQDTLRSPPPETETMKKASTISVLITTFFYLCCGGFGYAAFGNSTPGNLLTGFGFYEPYWLVDLANVCIVLHLVGGYQVYSQPLFAVVEKWLAGMFKSSEFMNKEYALKLPLLPALRLNLLRLCFRTIYVACTTLIAMLFPYFNQVLGVLGAINFWPLSIYFPVEMYLVQKNIRGWTTEWIVLRCFSIACLLVTISALVGSIEGIVTEKLS
ncbi:probable amino acid permease 7 [Diospyros lotus]|uniref:probable amino acid permease 7 n=1 Tax=Diospyros lotus TaxID=55363 RepID=UPI002255DF17|nr:probable amino acid permease 7 [Diospyros lotus]